MALAQYFCEIFDLRFEPYFVGRLIFYVMIYKSGVVIQCAIVGMGFMGKKYLKELLKNAEVKLVAFCDLKPPVSLDIKEAIPEQIPYYERLDEMLSDNHLQIDLVILATPNGCHVDQALQVLEKK